MASVSNDTRPLGGMTIYDSPGPRKGRGGGGINNDMTITINITQ